MADIFISYKKEDRKVTEALAAALEAEGLSVWWDNALNPKSAWDAMIEQEIAAARKVLVLWSPRAVKSDWVRSEAHYAQDHGKLVPVKIEDCTLPLAFMLRQAVDLSDHKFDAANPEWQRLLEWIAEEGDTDDGIGDESVATPAPKKESWLGPKKRPVMAFGLATILVAVAVIFGFMKGGLAEPEMPQPDLVVDRFEVRGDTLPAGFAGSLHDEMAAEFSTSSRITPEDGDGTRRLDAYQVQGSVETDEENIRLFARIFAPGIKGPVLTHRTELALEYEADAARSLGSELARLVRCIATASDSTGREVVLLPTGAIEPWADSCRQAVVGGADAQTRIATMRRVVEAAPAFANGWATLGEMLFWQSAIPSDDRAAFREESLEALERAIELDPATGKAYAIKAFHAIGLAGNLDREDRTGPIGDFEEWERLARQSIEVRPSDCGCEVPQYAAILMALGQPSEGLPLLQRAVRSDPRHLPHIRDYAIALAASGRPDNAQALIKQASEDWPQYRSVASLEMYYAFAAEDFAGAKEIYVEAAGDDADPRVIELFSAFDSGDADRIKAASQFIAESETTASQFGFTVLAKAGLTDAAWRLFERANERRGLLVFNWLWSPDAAEIRRTPEFEKFARSTKLIEYWKAGSAPDFCDGDDPAPVCTAVG